MHTYRTFSYFQITEKYFSEALELSKCNLESQFLQLESRTNQEKASTRDLILSVKEELADKILRLQSDCGIPLSVCFSAHKDEDYQAVWSTLIGRGMSRLGSHWSRASRVVLSPAILCHKEPARAPNHPTRGFGTENTPISFAPRWFFMS